MKTKTPTPALNRQILDEASEWFVDFRVGDVDTAARERFDEWLRRSPEHIRAYWEIAKTYVELPAAPAPGKLDVAALIAYAHSDANVVSLHSRASPAHTLRAESAAEGSEQGRAGPTPRFRRPFFAAASVAFALVIGGAVWWPGLSSTAPLKARKDSRTASKPSDGPRCRRPMMTTRPSTSWRRR